MQRQSYGLIEDGKLVIVDETQPGAKPVVYEDIPEGFDQMTSYIRQQAPVDAGSHIFMGIEMLEAEQPEGGEWPGEEFLG